MKYQNKGFISQLILLVIGIVVVGAGTYAYVNSGSKENPSQTPGQNQQSDAKPTTQDDSAAAATTTATGTTPVATNATGTIPVKAKPPASIPKAHNAFGFDLIQKIKPDEGGKNIFISPSSVALALSMTYNGANGETKNAMQKGLHLQGIDIATINQESRGLLDSLKNPDPKVELRIANSVWAKKDMNFVQSFISTVKDVYSAEVSTLDFISPEATKTINSWVSKNTNGKITKIVDQIPTDMVMYLINAVYFKGSWTQAFDKAKTTTKPFTTTSNGTKQVQMMSRSDDLPYFENADFQSVKLSYGNSGRINMYVFLPKEAKSISTFVSGLTPDKWNSWMSSYSKKPGDISLPKFKVEYEKQLSSVLSSMGMTVAFQDGADFSGIGRGLKISEVKHKSFVDVNEEGTEAAAVTSVGITLTSIKQNDEQRFKMEVNRPFFFAIADEQTKEILFMGVIQNP